MQTTRNRVRNKLLPLALLLAMIVPAASPALEVNGRINSDTRWTISDSPVGVIGDLLVATAATLTIDPGVVVVFHPRPDTTRGYNLTVDGTLDARGEAGQPIVFTAQNREQPWGSIIFNDASLDWDAVQSAGSILSYCVVEYGGNNPAAGAMILIDNAMPRIADSAIRFSASAGIAALSADAPLSSSGNLQIIANRIYANLTGLILDGEGGLVAGNYFLNNGRAINVVSRANDLEIRANTIQGSSDELFGSGLLLELDESTNGITAYRWEQTGGPSVELQNPNGARPTFIAPDPGADVYELTLDLTVTGGSAVQATAAVGVTVIGSNVPPVAVAGADQTIALSSAAPVVLSAAGSFDPDTGIAGYRWVQTAGRTVTLQSANTVRATFTVPTAVVAGEQMSFELTVTDTGGLESSDTVTIRYHGTNIFPVAAAGADITAVQGEIVFLDGSASRDPDGVIRSFLWTQTGGPAVLLFNFNTARPFFEAPTVVGSSETLTFELRVEDNGGLADTDELTVHVYRATIPDAGDDQTVVAGRQVTLDGSGSVDREASADIVVEANDIGSDNPAAGLVAITALEGAQAQLGFADNNFTFAETPGFAVFLFDWPEAATAVDMAGNWWGSTQTDVIDARIYDRNDDPQLPEVAYQPFAEQAVADAGSDLVYPPIADAGPDGLALVDQTVTLDGSNSFDPDGIGVYQWQQIEGPTVALRNAQSAVATFVAPPGGAEGRLLRFRLTMTTGDVFSHTDDVSVFIGADQPLPVVQVGGSSGCFIQSTNNQPGGKRAMGAMMIAAVLGILLGFGISCGKRGAKTLLVACVLLIPLFIGSPAGAGFFAVGGGDGGDAEQYNISLETGARGIDAGALDLMFAIGLPLIPHSDENLPENTIAFACPNDDCQALDSVRKGTEAGLYGKLGVRIGSTNLYLNAIGGFTVYTESQLARSPGSGNVFEQSTDTTIEPLYGGGLSYFVDHKDWPILFQIDYDVTRGVTGSVGWHW